MLDQDNFYITFIPSVPCYSNSCRTAVQQF